MERPNQTWKSKEPLHLYALLLKTFSHLVSVESVGMLPASTLVSEAIKILIEKIESIQKELISGVPDIASFRKKKKQEDNNNEDGMDF